MGFLHEGKWHDTWYNTQKSKGTFVRESSQFRHWITPSGEQGPTGEAGFKAEPNRYHVYFSYACPWACRVLTYLSLKDLHSVISSSVVSPDMVENGWTFEKPYKDPLYQNDYLYQIYLKADPNYSGRVTVPVLWDKQQETIVNNESAEIIRMLNSAFDEVTGNTQDFYPSNLQKDIDEINDTIYHNINNGVYRCGFATTQEAYEQAFDELFEALERIDSRLSNQDYLFGSEPTEADWRLFTTLIRFDIVYYSHFKCNLRMLRDFQHLPQYIQRIYAYPGIKETVNFEHIKRHYYYSQRTINPTQIVPKGPEHAL